MGRAGATGSLHGQELPGSLGHVDLAVRCSWRWRKPRSRLPARPRPASVFGSPGAHTWHVCSPKSRKNIHRGLSSINFVMILIATVTPLLLWYQFQDGYFLRGLWTFCDRFGCNEIFDPGAYLDVAQALSVLTDMVGLIALLSAWELFKIFIDWNIDENITSCVTNFITGALLLATLLITFFKLRTVVDINGNRLKPFYGFYIGCIACSLCFILGIYSMLRAKSVIAAEKMRKQRESLAL